MRLPPFIDAIQRAPDPPLDDAQQRSQAKEAQSRSQPTGVDVALARCLQLTSSHVSRPAP